MPRTAALRIPALLSIGSIGAALLVSCVTAPEKEQTFFQLETSSTLVGYHKVVIQLKDSLGNIQATLYDDSLPDMDLLNHLSAGPYKGGTVYIAILAYEGDRLAYRETRLYDGANQEVLSLQIFRDTSATPIVPVVPVNPKTDTTAKPVMHAPVITVLPWDTLVSIKDSVPLPAEAVDYDGDLAGYSWDCDGDGHPEDSAALSGSLAKIRFSRTYADSGTRVCVLKVWDKAGLSTQGKVKIRVVTDPPSASAGHDTTVVVGTTILLHAMGTDGMGPIVYMEWQIGSADFRRIPQAETSIKAPNAPGDLVCVLRVTDSDALTALDTMVVKVVYNADDSLADLRTNVGKLQPAFRKDMREYTLAVAAEDSVLVLSTPVNEVHAQAVVQAPDISPSLPGTVPLKTGDNFITIQVTAQDGSTLQYSVTARRPASK